MAATETRRRPAETRARILEAAFQEMHRHGYQGMRVEVILERTGLKKGALYHHFSGKLALGHAVLDEVIARLIDDMWLAPLAGESDVIAALEERLSGLAEDMGPEALQLGCPLNNLSQEMSPLDDGFRRRIEAIFQEWIGKLGQALRRGQAQGYVDADVDVPKAATFIVGAIEGCIGMAKNAEDWVVFRDCSEGLVRYLRGLRTEASEVASPSPKA